MYSNAQKQYGFFENVENLDVANLSEVTGAIENYAELKETERSASVRSRIGQEI